MKTHGTKPTLRLDYQPADTDILQPNNYYVLKAKEIVDAGEIIFKGIEQCETDYINEAIQKIQNEEPNANLIYAYVHIWSEIIGTQEVYWAEMELTITVNEPQEAIIFTASVILAIALGVAIFAIAVSVVWVIWHGATYGDGYGWIIILLIVAFAFLVLFGASLGITKKGVSFGKSKK